MSLDTLVDSALDTLGVLDPQSVQSPIKCATLEAGRDRAE